MWTVAGEAGKLASALQKARALAEVDRLMTHVPWILEIRGGSLCGWHAMTLPAKIVDFGRGQLRRIPDVTAFRLCCMDGPGTVA